ncbi:MAG: pyridoxine 5'-phosphate synthase [Arenimonas sp.]
MTLLSVNVNKVAVLRNSRGGHLPSVIEAAKIAMAAGAGGITVHPRPDLRHILPSDVRALAALVANKVEFNIEGNPFAEARGEYPGLLSLVRETRPTQVTLVPDGDGQITSDHGFNLRQDHERLHRVISELKPFCERISLFVDQDVDDLPLLVELGADRIEIYTGPYADSFENGDVKQNLSACQETALRAQALDIGINAGHDLNQKNLLPFLAALPMVREVSIGHALFNDALYDGLYATVQNYLHAIASTR